MKAINDYLEEQNLAILHDRATRDKVPLTKEAMLAWMQQTVDYVRTIVIQLDDGTYRVGYDSKTSPEKAFNSAEMNGLGAAIPKLGTLGVTRLWAQEINPRAIMGKTVDPKGVVQEVIAPQLMTSSKDGLERIVKRLSKRNGDEFAASYVLLNDGIITEPHPQLPALVEHHTYTLKDMFPGLFSGNGRNTFLDQLRGGGDTELLGK